MNPKVVIGDDESSYVDRVAAANRSANDAAAEVTMFKRRVSTFYDAVTQVRFPADAPSWASDWYEWLLTGKVAPTEEPDTPANDSVPPVV